MYDLIVIGSGPAGYVAAERAGEAGKSVLLVEREEVLGGVCLNWGCVPTKTLLNCGKIYHAAAHGEGFGVSGDLRFDFGAAMARKRKVVGQLGKGVAMLMKKAKVEVVRGAARIVAPGKVAVAQEVLEARDILLCTGSRSARPPIPGADQAHVLDSRAILDCESLPQRLAVVGGGVIGVEFASFFASVGVEVSVIEMLPEIVPGTDAEIARLLRTELAEKGIAFHCGARVEAIESDAVRFTDAQGQGQSCPADSVLMATGRRPNVEDLGLEDVGVAVDGGRIAIDAACRTNVPGIWAAGDCTGKILLAHLASRQAECVVNNICGRADRMRYHAVPGVIYTAPEVAAVGLTEAEAADRGREVVAAKLPMSVSGRFLAEHDGRGLVKVVADRHSRVLLGVHLIGGHCSEMIYGACAMIESETRIDEIKEYIFPHPTVCEVIREAVHALRF
ncbi:MAG: dihydrolipoyl dehydrogenase [Planctomycetota bacterium]